MKKKVQPKNCLYFCYVIGILALIFNFCFMGCAPIYIPNPVNVPLHTKKGEVNASGSLGFSGFNLQASFALSNHLCIMSNASYWDGKESGNNENHQFYEGGIGYFRKLGKPSTWYECFGGLGWGKTTNYNTINDITNQGTYLRYFLQQSIGLTSEIIDGAISLRLAYVDFSGINVNSNWFIEPVLTVKVGYKAIKLFGQIGISFNINQEFNIDDYEPLILNMGISYDFGKYR